jgi:hypothetical protein
MKVKVTPTNRLVCAVLTVTGTILFLTSFMFFHIFLLDIEFSDKLGLPRSSKNTFFDICNHVSCEKYGSVNLRIEVNLLLIISFWIQHIIMANQFFKAFMTKISNYPVYERGLYVISKIYISLFN